MEAIKKWNNLSNMYFMCILVTAGVACVKAATPHLRKKQIIQLHDIYKDNSVVGGATISSSGCTRTWLGTAGGTQAKKPTCGMSTKRKSGTRHDLATEYRTVSGEAEGERGREKQRSSESRDAQLNERANGRVREIRICKTDKQIETKTLGGIGGAGALTLGRTTAAAAANHDEGHHGDHHHNTAHND